MDPSETGTDAQLREEAATWLVEMDLNPQQWDRHRFVRWLRSSPHHMEEFLLQSALWSTLHQLDRPHLNLRTFVSESANVRHSPCDTEGDEKPRSHLRRWWLSSSVGTALAAAVILAVLIPQFFKASVFATTTGEQRALRLPDHSVMHLNTRSRAEVQFTRQFRDVRLVEGEAIFIVEPDATRPFRVQTASMEVKALGTEFNVRSQQGETLLCVLEGRVAVTAKGSSAHPRTATVVSAGEEARVRSDGSIDKRSIPNVLAVTAWRQRRLVFNGTPLSEVADELSMYNVSPRVRIEGAALQNKKLSGVFSADDPESLIQFLARDESLTIMHRDDEVWVRSRERPGQPQQNH